MARRSPTNARYQKYTEPKGQTRKSSASAKPVRKEGGAATSSKDKAKSKTAAPGSKYYEPDTPEYKFWRRMWWTALGVGLVLVAISFGVEWWGPLRAQPWSRFVGTLIIGLAYVAIIAAFLVDFRRLRPMRLGTYVSKKDKPLKPPTTSDADKTEDPK